MSLSAAADVSSFDSTVARQQKSIATARNTDDKDRCSSRDDKIPSMTHRGDAPYRQPARSGMDSSRNYRDGKLEKETRRCNDRGSNQPNFSSAGQHSQQRFDERIDGWNNSADDAGNYRRICNLIDIEKEGYNSNTRSRWVDPIKVRRNESDELENNRHESFNSRTSDIGDIRNPSVRSNQLQGYATSQGHDYPDVVALRKEDRKDWRNENLKNSHEEILTASFHPDRNLSEISNNVKNSDSLEALSGETVCWKVSKSEDPGPMAILNEDSLHSCDYEREMQNQSLGDNLIGRYEGPESESDNEDLL